MHELTIRRRAASAFLVGGGFVLLFLLALAASALPPAASAQSGRRRPAPISPVPTPTPAAPAQKEGHGESESVPRGAESKGAVVASFVVFENEDAFLNIDRATRNDLTEAFLRRLGQASGVSVAPAGRGGRREARDRAKTEREAFVVVFQVEEDTFASGRTGVGGRSDPRTFVIRTYVFAPGSGDLKYQDTTHQRPYRETATVGGVRIPVPGRRIERYPSELELQQAARDAADRLLSRFNVILPPDR
jgi:hypothetical protein